MKKLILSIFLICALSFSSCIKDPIIPACGSTYTYYDGYGGVYIYNVYTDQFGCYIWLGYYKYYI